LRALRGEHRRQLVDERIGGRDLRGGACGADGDLTRCDRNEIVLFGPVDNGRAILEIAHQAVGMQLRIRARRNRGSRTFGACRTERAFFVEVRSGRRFAGTADLGKRGCKLRGGVYHGDDEIGIL